MSASLLELRKKIALVKQTGKITQAMRMVSAVKLNQTEKKDKGYTLYNDTLKKTVSHLMSARIVGHLESENVPVNSKNLARLDYTNVFGLGTISDLVQARPKVKSTEYLIITGDRGLVGSYNSAVIRNMMGLFEDSKAEDKDIKVLAVDRVGAQSFKKSDMNVVCENSGISGIPSFDEVLPIISTTIRMCLNDVYGELYVCCTHHVNSLSFAFCAEKILPIFDLDIDGGEAEAHARLECGVDSGADTALKTLLPQFAHSTTYGAILNMKTVEHASSMTTMQSASDNASDLVSRSTMQMNRVRQTRITTELSEIIDGADALE